MLHVDVQDFVVLVDMSMEPMDWAVDFNLFMMESISL